MFSLIRLSVADDAIVAPAATTICECRNFWSRDRGIAEPIVHIAIRYLHPLPPNLSLAEATLIETLATVHHA